MTDEMDALDAITDKVLAYKPPQRVRKPKTSEGVRPSQNATGSELLIYQSPDGKTRIDVRMDGETVWLTQVQMAELFQTTRQNISLHVNNVFAENELQKSATIKDSLIVQNRG